MYYYIFIYSICLYNIYNFLFINFIYKKQRVLINFINLKEIVDSKYSYNNTYVALYSHWLIFSFELIKIFAFYFLFKFQI